MEQARPSGLISANPGWIKSFSVQTDPMTTSSPTKSAEEYREDARRARAMAETVTTPGLRETLLNMAAIYDKLARRADDLAKS
jgi:hypothetical protein